MPSPPSRCPSPLFSLPQLETSHLPLLYEPLNHQVPDVSLEALLLSRPIPCELYRLHCHGHSLLLFSYLHRISRKENSACSDCGHPLQYLNHLLLDCPASEPLCKSIFGSSLFILDLWSRPWSVARLLGLRGAPPRPIPRKGSSSTTTTNKMLRGTIKKCVDIDKLESLCRMAIFSGPRKKDRCRRVQL